MGSLKSMRSAVALLACLLLTNSANAAPSNCPPLSMAVEDRESLRREVVETGRGIFLFRHDEKNEISGVLTTRGQLHARTIGWAFMGIPIANAVYYATKKPRVKQTAKLAFPNHQYEQTNFDTDEKVPNKAQIEAWAKEKIHGLSDNGNLIAFVDSQMIDQFETKDAQFACGEGLLLLPGEGGKYECKARFFPEEWLHPKATLPPWITDEDASCARNAAALRAN